MAVKVLRKFAGFVKFKIIAFTAIKRDSKF